MRIQYKVVAAEDIDFPNHTFDVITACQCFFCFDHEKAMPKLFHMLKRMEDYYCSIWRGRFLITGRN